MKARRFSGSTARTSATRVAIRRKTTAASRSNAEPSCVPRPREPPSAPATAAPRESRRRDARRSRRARRFRRWRPAPPTASATSSSMSALELRRLVADEERGDQENSCDCRWLKSRMTCRASRRRRAAAGARRPPADARGRWRARRSRSGTGFRPAAWCRSRPHRFVCRAPGSRGARAACRREDRSQRALLYNPAKIRENSSERALQSPAVVVETGLVCMSRTVFRARIGRRVLQGARRRRAGAPGRRHAGAHRVLRRAAARQLSPAASRRVDDEAPLALRLAQALESGGMRQRASLKQIGDLSLFIVRVLLRLAESQAGRRRLLRQHRRLRLQRAEPGRDRHVLAGVRGARRRSSSDFVDVLSEVSERTSCASNVDLLRLYEKWLKTGSRRSGQLLVERGVVPNASIKVDTIQ